MTRKLSVAKITWRENYVTHSMLIIKIATLSPSHTSITIILSYSVVMFWSSLSLLFSVSTPGSTSFVQSSNCPLIGHCWLSLIKFRDMLNNIDKETKCVSIKNAKLKWVKMQNFRKIAKLRCREICEPQNREINVSRKFHVIRYIVYFFTFYF